MSGLGARTRPVVRGLSAAFLVAALLVGAATPASAQTTVTPGGYHLTWHWSQKDVELMYPGVLGGTVHPTATSVDVFLSDSFAYYTNEVWLVKPYVQYIGVPVHRTDIEAKNAGFSFTANGIRIDGLTPGAEVVFAIRSNIGTNPPSWGGAHQDAPFDPLNPDPHLIPPPPSSESYEYPSDYYTYNKNFVFYTGASTRNIDGSVCATCGFHDKAQYLVGGQFGRSGVAAFLGYEDYFRTPAVMDQDFNDAGILVLGAGRRPGPTPTTPNPPDGGCTLTIGYWKNHLTVLQPLLPQLLGLQAGPSSVLGSSVNVTTTSQAKTLLQYSSDSSNGINKLYGQLLAAKLNVVNTASLADPSAVTATVGAADTFLSTHAASSWTLLSPADQAQVLAWMTTLDSYNNGAIGPGHCP